MSSPAGGFHAPGVAMVKYLFCGLSGSRLAPEESLLLAMLVL